MFPTRLYYRLKPLLPWSVRMTVRRWFAVRKRRRVADVWPILPGSERPPDGWPGWPDGKQFALVLTHDVESQVGLDRVKQVAELEMKLGFRSCFNFVPEGDYTVPLALRTWLTENRFEIAVHDLHHDGTLYRSRRGFLQQAQRINHYLKACLHGLIVAVEREAGKLGKLVASATSAIVLCLARLTAATIPKSLGPLSRCPVVPWSGGPVVLLSRGLLVPWSLGLLVPWSLGLLVS